MSDMKEIGAFVAKVRKAQGVRCCPFSASMFGSSSRRASDELMREWPSGVYAKILKVIARQVDAVTK